MGSENVVSGAELRAFNRPNDPRDVKGAELVTFTQLCVGSCKRRTNQGVSGLMVSWFSLVVQMV